MSTVPIRTTVQITPPALSAPANGNGLPAELELVPGEPLYDVFSDGDLDRIDPSVYDDPCCQAAFSSW